MSHSTLPPVSRRDLLVNGSKLSLVSFALLSGLNPKARAQDDQSVSAQDIDILNEILGTEHEGIAAYQTCFDRGILQKSVAHIAKIFQDHHKAHRDILDTQIQRLGGAPAVAKKQDEYVDDLGMVRIKAQKGALHFLAKLEVGAANGYIGMIPSTNDHELAKMAGRIAADEVMHWTVWATRLGIAIPAQPLSFGA